VISIIVFIVELKREIVLLRFLTNRVYEMKNERSKLEINLLMFLGHELLVKLSKMCHRKCSFPN